MNAAKPAIAAGAVILGLAAIPMLWQESRASKLREEIGALEQRRTLAAAQIAEVETQRTAFENSPAMATRRTARDLLTYAEAPVDIGIMMDSMMEVMMSQDIIGMLKIFMPLANLSRSEYDRLLEELEEHEGNAQQKQVVTMMLGMFAPAGNPQEALERMVRREVEPYAYSNLLGKWAADDPEAALAWYNAKLESGALYGKGIGRNPERYLYAELISGMAKSDPEGAVDHFLERVSDDSHNAAARLASSLGLSIARDGDDTQLLRLLAWDSDGNNSQHIVTSAMKSAVHDKPFAEVRRFAETYLGAEKEQRSAVVSHMVSHKEAPMAESASQLVGYLPEDEAPGAIAQLVRSDLRWSNGKDARQWLETQPTGAVRDGGFETLSSNATGLGNFEIALADAQQIAGEETRQSALTDLGRRWLRSDEAAARAALPADVIEAAEAEGDSRSATEVLEELPGG